MKKRGLGRNLDVLLGRSQMAAKPANTSEQEVIAGSLIPANSAHPQHVIRQIPVELLQRGRYQPRREFTQQHLQELADSIRAQGIIQPIVVRPVDNGRFEIIAGERRWRAAQQAGLNEVPAMIKDVPDNAVLAMALIENIQREDLNPIEEAIALQRLAEEFKLTHQEIAEAVGKSRATITNLLRLLSLPADIKRLLEQGEIDMGHARALLTLAGHAQVQAAKQVIEKKLSVRETETLVRQLQNGLATHSPKSTDKTLDPNIKRLQKDLSEQLGVMVNFQHSSKGKGKMILHYNSLDELQGILEKIQ